MIIILGWLVPNTLMTGKKAEIRCPDRFINNYYNITEDFTQMQKVVYAWIRDYIAAHGHSIFCLIR